MVKAQNENFIDVYQTPEVIPAPSISGEQPEVEAIPVVIATEESALAVTEVPAPTIDAPHQPTEAELADLGTPVVETAPTAEPTASEGASA